MFSRSNPSPLYVDLIRMYQEMHVEGERFLNIPAAQTFPGQSLLPQSARIKTLVQRHQAKTLLDYGAGKGQLYQQRDITFPDGARAATAQQYWGLQSIQCYDPCYQPFSALPTGKFDGVISTDVLEHCSEQDIDWILDEIFSYANHFVYANVACYPAKKRLPNGENAHCTIFPPAWWEEKLCAVAKKYPALDWEVWIQNMTPAGAVESCVRSNLPIASSNPAPIVPSTALPPVALPPAAPPVVGPNGQINLAEYYKIAPKVHVKIEGVDTYFSIPSEKCYMRVDTLFTKEPDTIQWLNRIQPGEVMVDVGANVGMYSIYAGKVRKARVFAFEPEAQNYAVLNQNIYMNHLGANVSSYCIALSDEFLFSSLYLSKLDIGGSCHSFGEEVDFHLKPSLARFPQGCLSFTLDDLIAKNVLPIPSFIKIDVDGFEHKVISGMMQTLQSPSVRSVIIEINNHLTEHQALVANMTALGFRFSPTQVDSSMRKSGPFTGVGNYVFDRS